RGAERADAERVVGFELHEGGDLLQHLSDRLLVHGLHQARPPASAASLGAASSRRQPSSSSSSVPTSVCRPAWAPPSIVGANNAEPSRRTSPRGREPCASTTVNPSRSGLKPNTASTRSRPSVARSRKHPSSGSWLSPSTGRAQRRLGGT